MRSNYYWTYQENGRIICGWRSSIVGLVYGDMNNKKRILLQLLPHVHYTTTAWKTKSQVKGISRNKKHYS